MSESIKTTIRIRKGNTDSVIVKRPYSDSNDLSIDIGDDITLWFEKGYDLCAFCNTVMCGIDKLQKDEAVKEEKIVFSPVYPKEI